MTLEAWLAFAAIATAFLLMPHPLAALTAAFSASWGRSSAFVTVPASIIAMVLCAIPATAAVFALGFYWQSAIDSFSWAGLAYLMIYMLYAYQAPEIRIGLAANDNLPETRPMRVLGYFILTAFRKIRYFALTAALAIQVVDPNLSAGKQFGEIIAAFAIGTGIGVLAYSFFPRRFSRRRRRVASPRHALYKPGTLFIARRAVTAGYRRIAA
ncbi:threonine efflux protein [Neorhizobium sp. NCHU2750]|nr:threonine efflux protein [Neorhizobium sp. NCHU2750]